jgi:hypothetical protein
VTEHAPDTWTMTCEDISPGGNPEFHGQVQWCPAWRIWLCADCRGKWGTTELRTTLADRPVPRILPPDPALQL